MPLQVQCVSVVIRGDALDRVLEDGRSGFADIAPNAMSYADGSLAQASFMATDDAEAFIRNLELRGLRRDVDPPDFVVVRQHDRSVEPRCDWLILFEYEKRLIASLRGDRSTTVIAPADDRHHGPGAAEHYTEAEVAERFEFVDREGGIDVYRDRVTGELAYHARSEATADEAFRAAFRVIWEHRREPGTPSATGRDAEAVRDAIGSLQSLSSKYPEVAKVSLALGMGWFAVGEHDRARRCLERAADLSPDDVPTLKELGSVCLVMADVSSALRVGRAAVAVCPDDVELLGNLAAVQLLDDDAAAADRTIRHALDIEPGDVVNRNIRRVIDDVRTGRRPRPETLDQLMTPAEPSSWWRWFVNVTGVAGWPRIRRRS